MIQKNFPQFLQKYPPSPKTSLVLGLLGRRVRKKKRAKRGRKKKSPPKKKKKEGAFKKKKEGEKRAME